MKTPVRSKIYIYFDQPSTVQKPRQKSRKGRREGDVTPDVLKELRNMSPSTFQKLYRTKDKRWKIVEIYDDFVDPVLSHKYAESSKRRRSTANTLIKHFREKGFSIYTTHVVKPKGWLSAIGVRSLFQYAIVKNPLHAKQLSPYVPLYHKIDSIKILIVSMFNIRDPYVKEIASIAEKCAKDFAMDKWKLKFQ